MPMRPNAGIRALTVLHVGIEQTWFVTETESCNQITYTQPAYFCRVYIQRTLDLFELIKEAPYRHSLSVPRSLLK